MKNIWIWNHYATGMLKARGGRHYNFARFLKKDGYLPTIFCANTIHNENSFIDLGKELYKIEVSDDIPFVIVKTSPYVGNGFSRIKNMLQFSLRIRRVVKNLSKENLPDIILASSVHPFTCVAGIKTAKKLGVPCVVEIRDLWPESIIEFAGKSRRNPFIWMMRRMEKWIYKNADKIIFTMPGGADYIKDMGWDREVKDNKVHNINNGIVLEEFYSNQKAYLVKDQDLLDDTTFKVIYTGAMRAANNIKFVLEAAKIVQDKFGDKIKFLLYGGGEELPVLEKYVADHNITNVVFKGFVEKVKIPAILSYSNLNLVHYIPNNLGKYGGSHNKLFEYLASGKPILMDLDWGKYDIVESCGAGIVLKEYKPEKMADAIIYFTTLDSSSYNKMCAAAQNCAKKYDFSFLTKTLEDVLVSIKTKTV